MKIRHLHISILLVSVIILLSCKKTVNNIDYPEYKPQLVIYSFISPSDTIVRVHVSTTKNIFGQRTDYPKSLPVKVTLIDNGLSIPFSSADTVGYCYLKHQIDPGKEYKIIAQCEGYPEASGVCKVPEIKDLNITLDTTTIFTSYDGNIYTNSFFKLIFNDIQTEIDYYNVGCVESNYYKFNTVITKELIPLHVYFQDNNNDYRETKLISDHLIDGQSISTSFSYYYSNDINLTGVEFEAYVLGTDADYYLYHKSLLAYKGSDEPFTEFSPVYSNITGGLGIFCSYVKYQKTLKLK